MSESKQFCFGFFVFMGEISLFIPLHCNTRMTGKLVIPDRPGEREETMNKVVLMGRLTRDAEIRYSQGENSTAISRFNLAVDRRFKRDGDEQTADFISCVAFGRVAEFMEKFGHKGTKFVLEGRIQTGSYTNKDGQRVYTTDVVVENIEFAESKSNSGNSDNAPQPAPAGADGFMNLPEGIDDEDLPFN
mgnify:FL=1